MAKENAATATSYLVNGTMVTGGALTFNEWMMFGGFVLGCLTFAVNVYFQYQRNKMLKQQLDQDKK